MGFLSDRTTQQPKTTADALGMFSLWQAGVRDLLLPCDGSFACKGLQYSPTAQLIKIEELLLISIKTVHIHSLFFS